jgi:hypothetical protein
VVLSQAKQAATATVRGFLQTEDGSAMAEVVAPLVRDLILRIETVVAITGLSSQASTGWYPRNHSRSPFG